VALGLPVTLPLEDSDGVGVKKTEPEDDELSLGV
jgi:hypothetical protein